MKLSAGYILTALYIGGFILWLLSVTILFTGILPGWGLYQPLVLWLLLVWVVVGGSYGAWKTLHEFHERARFGWRQCLSRACPTVLSNILVAAMAPLLLFITTSAIVQNAEESIEIFSAQNTVESVDTSTSQEETGDVDSSTNQIYAPSLAWGSIGVSLLAAVAAFLVLNEHIHSAISRKVRMIPLETERPGSSPLHEGKAVKYLGNHPSGTGRTLKAYLVLVGHAARRETITYGALRRKLKETPPNLTNHLRLIFDYCERNRLPRLVTLVVSGMSGEPSYDYPGPRDSIYVDREEVYAYDWLELVPPTINELAART